MVSPSSAASEIAAFGRQAEPLRATEAEVPTSLAVAPSVAAVILLATVAMGHAEVGRPAPKVRLLDAPTRLPSATSAVILRHAGRKNPVPTSSALPPRAAAPNACRPQTAVVLLHLSEDKGLPSDRSKGRQK